MLCSQVLMRFLTVLRKLSPEEKVVIVSNFTATLDEIEAACGGRWGEALRLDGKVPVDQRQALVNRFNRPDDASFMFLLSAKAGGVGINL
jgi:DNA repair and recombination protein RAD54B